MGFPQGVPIQLVNGRRRITKTEKKEEATGPAMLRDMIYTYPRKKNK